MIRKLRWKFTLVAVASISIVLIALVLGINIFYSSSTQAGQDSMLRLITANDGILPRKMPRENGKLIKNINFTPEAPFDTRYFSIWTDAGGNVLDVHMEHIAAISGERAEEIIGRIADGKSEYGIIDNYRYLRSADGDRLLYVFLDIARQQMARRNLVRISLLLTAAAIFAAFILAYAFSGTAVASTVKNMEAQKRFITDASHELKTPLTAISAYKNMLKEELPEDRRITGMEAETKRLNNLVVNLVELSRWDEEKPLVKADNFSVTDALWDVAEPYKGIAVGKNRDIVIDIEEDMDSYGDEIAIQRAFSLLLENAIRHSVENSIIHVNACKRKQKIEIDVINECEPDLKIDLNRIFDRFYRPDESRSRQSGGNGVGLSIVKAIVNAHGGAVKADRPGENTIRFRIILKAVQK